MQTPPHTGSPLLAAALHSAPLPGSSVPNELRALLNHAGVFDRNTRTAFACHGQDRVRWLNGMVTNHVGELQPHRGCYAFVLNAQGRIQGDVNIFQMGDSLWLDIAATQAATLLAYLEHYIIMDDVVLAPLPETHRIGIAGPQAAAWLTQMGLSVAELQPLEIGEVNWNGVPITVIAAHSPIVPYYDLWIAPKNAADFSQALLAAGFTACGAKAIEQLRILEGTPLYGKDIVDRDLPQETNQTRALHFSKGCYLGQEIVERIRSRGNVHRIFTGFVLDSGFSLDAASPARLPVLSGDQTVGEITSSTQIEHSDGSRQGIALGYIRREALDKKMELHCSGHPVRPETIPFTKIL